MLIRWKGREILADIKDTIETRLKMVGNLGVRDIKQSLSIGAG